jgi:hypothetical protein
VIWPEGLSPRRTVAVIRIPKQEFTSAEQLAFARQLRFNPWHALPEHRPLGNQNRARRHIYQFTSAVRQSMNGEAHVEPTGEETFPGSPPLPPKPSGARAPPQPFEERSTTTRSGS